MVTIALVGCAPRGTFHFEENGQAAHVVQPIYVATNRLRDDDQTQGFFRQDFGDNRDSHVRFARMDISIPPSHTIGRIEWPGHNPPNSNRHFVVQENTLFDGENGFLTDLNHPANSKDVIVFVHGFNVNYAEAVYRLAQVAHDYQSQLPVIAFSWPSAGSSRGYAYDRDSVTFSRDSLETLFSLLARKHRKVYLVAHSMGSQLVVETLRQMSISGNRSALAQFESVTLISPDIDEDVFIQQLRRIDPLPVPFTLMVSQHDRALDISAFLTGKPNRLGTIQSGDRLGDFPVNVVDLSYATGGDRSGHSTAFTSPEVIEALRTW
ncbi:alpha/beta hydrolase [Pelagimonas varians]|uniref:Alpha/beta hydrolase family protein n=1 Tax=Pelagimonas varians TaxID=696760 RepID=A0A238JT36_9RHOB|nr:alpha/beta fold hydrolase [Pelagimonas varians]PYG34596.1 esterase/lipase superfamily enzyme [Pelagimonas varians]SMX33344.1 Alpha/beta hydrolase family protein [Pelagimonas varians]